VKLILKKLCFQREREKKDKKMNEIPPPIDSPPPDYNTAVNGPQNPIGKVVNKYSYIPFSFGTYS
jgi:hypothetical protein